MDLGSLLMLFKLVWRHEFLSVDNVEGTAATNVTMLLGPERSGGFQRKSVFFRYVGARMRFLRGHNLLQDGRGGLFPG